MTEHESEKMNDEEERAEDVAEVARDIIETLISKMGTSAEVEIKTGELVMPGSEAESSLVFNIKGDDLGMLIGRRGQILTSIQYLIRLMVSQRTKVYTPVVIDVNGYRQRRFEALRSMAMHMAEQVRQKQMPFSLEPMTAFDRRIIHLILADHPDVTTKSIGLGDNRKVVIILKENEAD